MIPTQSNNPTAYLPRFSPLCAPDNALKLMTSALNFHFFSFTSIQCAIIPRKPIFVVSADHPSAVIKTFPGDAYSGAYIFKSIETKLMNCLPLSPPPVPWCVAQICCEDKPSCRMNLEGWSWLIWVSLRWGCCEMQGCPRARGAIGVSWVMPLMVRWANNVLGY